MRTLAQLLDPAHAFLILTVYAIRASALSIDALAREALAGRGGSFESGEVAIAEAEGERLLSSALFTRWKSEREVRRAGPLAPSPACGGGRGRGKPQALSKRRPPLPTPSPPLASLAGEGRRECHHADASHCARPRFVLRSARDGRRNSSVGRAHHS